jgi:hypothetical protein
MAQPRVAGTISSIAFLFMVACNSNDRAGTDFFDIPVAEGQRTLAADAVNRLRDAFNSGSCQFIYEQAGALFRAQPLGGWMSQCRELRETLGSWQTFSASSARRCGGGPSEVVVCVRGTAGFVKGTKEVDVAWVLDNERTQLMWISLRQNEGTWVQMPPSRQRRIFDTPPRPLRKSDSAG